VRIRVGDWGRDATRGTVLLFPGRSEYVEKYGPAATDFAVRGFATVSVDWRGQGLAARVLSDRAIGHVNSFRDYQTDVAAVMAYVRAQGLPEPYYLLGHSMGGCIGLRSLMDGLPVAACAFTAPMWGIQMSTALRPIAWTLSSVSRPFGFSGTLAPGQVTETYVLRAPFDGNTLTSDAEMFSWLQSHVRAEPDLSLGGASLHWLNESLREMRALSAMPAPALPCLTFLGSEEKIVDPARIEARMARWPGGTLERVDGARHEIMLESASVRARVFDLIANHFAPPEASSLAS